MVKMDQARRLMEKGKYRESLLLALEVLLLELNNLRESLIALQIVTRLELETPAQPVQEEPPQPDHFWLPPVKARVLH
jgi:transcriptional regulator of aromatic amino acid metabolism